MGNLTPHQSAETSVTLQKIQNLRQTDKGLVLTQSVINDLEEDADIRTNEATTGHHKPVTSRTRMTSVTETVEAKLANVVAMSIDARSISATSSESPRWKE